MIKAKILLGGILLATLASFLSPILSDTAFATGETYKWKGADRIEGSGGKFKGTTLFNLDTSPGATFSGAVAYFTTNNINMDLMYPACSSAAAVIFVTQKPDVTKDMSASIYVGQQATNNPKDTTCLGSDMQFDWPNITVKKAAVTATPTTATDCSKLSGDAKTRCEVVNQCHDSLQQPSVSSCQKAWDNCINDANDATIAACKTEVAKGNLDYDAIKKQAAAQQEKATNTCTIDGIGWLVCPVMSFLATLNDGMFDFLAKNFLSLNIGLFDTNSGTFEAWKVFRSYANIAFVIVFLVIIYSQVTSAGISNYGIKRMLPRLIVAAILVNISYYLCQAAIDISNIAGFGIKNLFDSIKVGGSTVANTPQWLDVITKIIGGAVIGATLIGAVLALGSTVLLAAVLALAMITLILITRQAAIVLLIAISPLAFVAYLLPNTESWFKKWWAMFRTLLMVFPVIGAVFGATGLASRIILLSATGPNVPIDKQITLQLTALGLLAIPLFAVPALLKGAMAATGAIGARLQGMGDRATGRVSSRVKDSTYAGAYLSQRKKIRAANRAQSYGKGVRGYVSKSRFTGKAGTELAALGSALSSREEKEAVDNEIINMQKQSGWTEANRLDKAKEEFVGAMRSGDSTKARAAQQIMLSSGNAGISKLQESMESIEGDANYTSMMGSATGQKVLSDLNGSGVKGKNAALAKLAYSQEGTKVSSLANDGNTYSALNDAEVAGQSTGNIQKAITNGGITHERAAEMMNNQNVWSQLSEDKKTMIRNHAVDAGRTHDIDQAHDAAIREEALRNTPPPPNP